MICLCVGGFCFLFDEVDIMKCEIDVVRQVGLFGVVLGVIVLNGVLDVDLFVMFCCYVEGFDFMFYCVFDVVLDQLEVFEIVIDFGFMCILILGGKVIVVEGCEKLVQLIEQLKGCILIMFGLGVWLEIVGLFLERLFVMEIYVFCVVNGLEQDLYLVELYFVVCQMLQMDIDIVRCLKCMLGESCFCWLV